MRKNMLGITAFVLAGLAADAAAQVAIQPGSIVGTFQAIAQLQENEHLVYTAPQDRHARITDIIATNFSANACLFYLSVAGNNLWLQLPAAVTTVVVPLNSGIGLTAGTSITAHKNVGCTPNQAMVQVRGFHFTIP